MKKRDALEMSIKIWEYLADHPHLHDIEGKVEALKVLGFPLTMAAHCPACEYDDLKGGISDCGNCPIWLEDDTCGRNKTANYNKWNYTRVADEAERQGYARAIANLAKQRLQELTEREKATGREEI